MDTPTKGSTYYFAEGNNIREATWQNTDNDKRRLELNNVFKTKNEAQQSRMAHSGSGHRSA